MKYFRIILVLSFIMLLTGCSNKTYIVRYFVDDEVIKTEEVKKGEQALPPVSPVKEGYTFMGWSEEPTNVTSDLDIYAKFEKNIYTVKFIVDDKAISEQQVEHQKNVTPPEDPIKEGHTFIGWSEEFTNVTSDLDIYAKFEKNIYTVKFIVDDKVISEQQVLYQSAAVFPPNPSKTGFLFTGWNIDTSSITCNLDVYAIFEEDKEYIIDKKILEIDEHMNKYGTVLKEDITLIDSINDIYITWQSSNPQILSNEGLINHPYSEEKYISVLFTASIEYKGVTKEKSYSFKIERRYKDLSTGINAVYNSRSLMMQKGLETYDIIYPSFIYLSSDTTGNLSSTSEVISMTNGYKKSFHKLGGRIVPSLAVQSSTDIANLKTIIQNEQTLEKLVMNLLNYCIDNDFDGIDIDWETPGSSGGVLYTKLMKKLYETFKAYDSNLLVTSAIGGGPWQYKKYDLTNSNIYHDYINMMTYSMENSSVSTFQNALYYKSGACLTQCSVERSIELYQSVGVRLDQIIVGIPFYGRIFTDTDGLGTSGSTSSAPTAGTIRSYIDDQTYKYYFDEDCKVPYLYNETDRKFITYESVKSILIKWDYIKTNKIAGMMAWNYRQDTDDILTTAMQIGKLDETEYTEEIKEFLKNNPY